MNRFFESGDQVDCCAGEEAMEPPGDRQLVPAHLGPVRRAAAADGVRQPERLRPVPVRVLVLHHQPVAERVEVVAACSSGTSPGPTLKVAIDTFVGPVSVELDGVVQSTWNFQTRIAYAPQIDAK